MNNAFLQAVEALLLPAWNLMTSVRYPGTNVTIATILVGAFVAAFSLRIITWTLTRRFSVGSLGGGFGGRDKADKPTKK